MYIKDKILQIADIELSWRVAQTLQRHKRHIASPAIHCICMTGGIIHRCGRERDYSFHLFILTLSPFHQTRVSTLPCLATDCCCRHLTDVTLAGEDVKALRSALPFAMFLLLLIIAMTITTDTALVVSIIDLVRI